MGLNKAKGNMYEWVTHTWNPVGGTCPHKCSYCSTNNLMRYPVIKSKYTGDPRLYEKGFVDFGKGKFIFVAAQNDLFADGISDSIISRVINHCKRFDNLYLFQTKNPQRVIEWDLPLKSIICTTIESDGFYPDIMGDTPEPMQRSIAMQTLSERYETYVTIEPIMDFHLEHFVRMIRRCNPTQVNIGADSGGNNLPEPSGWKVLQLIESLKEFTTIDKKSNLKRLIGHDES